MDNVSDSSCNMKLARVTDASEASEATLKPSTADSSQSLINTFASSGTAGILPFDDCKRGIGRHRLGVHGEAADRPSADIAGGTVGSLASCLPDVITARHLPDAARMHCGTSGELMRQEPAMPLITAADQMTGSLPHVMQRSCVTTEQTAPLANTSHCEFMAEVCVFSTELANYAAESVRSGRHSNIIDFHHDYLAVPVSQNQMNASSFLPSNQSQMNCYPECQPSHPTAPAAAAQERTMGYDAQTGVEQWVRQQNASRQKQMAASSVYTGQVYGSCDQAAESEHYHYWSGHHKTLSSVGLDGSQMSSSVDFVRPLGYGNVDAMNVHHRENCSMTDGDLTLEQRQQRQSKMGRLQVIRQMLTGNQQVPISDEHRDSTRGTSFLQSRVPPAVSWNSMPYGGDVYAGCCNSGNQMMRSSAVSYDWDVKTSPHSWYPLPHEPSVNEVGIQNSFDRCQQADFCSRRYYGSHAASPSSAELRQLSVRDRVVPTHAMYECSALYPGCDPRVCSCQGHMSSSPMSACHLQSSRRYGYTDVSLQANHAGQQLMNRCSEFLNGSCAVPVAGNRQLLMYNVPYKLQNWNTGEDTTKQQLISASNPVPNQPLMLSPQWNNKYSFVGNTVTEPVRKTVSFAQAPTIASRQRQPKKRQNTDILTARLTDSKSKKLDGNGGDWSAARSGTLMNITSASLAHLAEGVENLSAAMQQTGQCDGSFRSPREPGVFDENANFISAGSSLQRQVPGVLSGVEKKVVAVSGCTSNTAGSPSTCSSLTVSSHSHVYADVSTTGVDVVVTSKTPYTISYLPSSVSSESDSKGNVGLRDGTSLSHNVRVIKDYHVPDAYSTLPGSEEGFSGQEQFGMFCRKNPDSRVDQQTGNRHLSETSSVAVIQPQMMSGTQLIIADHCSQSTSILNNFVLPSSSAECYRPLQHDTHYQSFAVQRVPVSGGGLNMPSSSSSSAVQPATDAAVSWHI